MKDQLGGTYQSSRLKGKYSYSISAVSSGLPFTPCCGTAVGTALPLPVPLTIDFIPTNCGLCMLSPEVDDRFGLRSSSDSDRFMGRVADDEVLRCRPPTPEGVVLGGGPTNLLRPLPLPLLLSQEGTGGLFGLGETAIFLFGGMFVLETANGLGVVGQSPDC